MERKKLVVLVTVLVIVLIIIEIIAFYILRNKKNDVTPDGPSINRINTLQQVLRSYFGDNYAVTLSVIFISVLVVLVMIYFLLKKVDNVEIKLNPLNEKILITILTTGYLIYVGFSIYLFMKMNKENNENLPDDVSDADLARKKFLKMSMYISGVIIMGFILIGLVVFLFSRLRGKK